MSTISVYKWTAKFRCTQNYSTVPPAVHESAEGLSRPYIFTHHYCLWVSTWACLKQSSKCADSHWQTAQKHVDGEKTRTKKHEHTQKQWMNSFPAQRNQYYRHVCANDTRKEGGPRCRHRRQSSRRTAIFNKDKTHNSYWGRGSQGRHQAKQSKLRQTNL